MKILQVFVACSMLEVSGLECIELTHAISTETTAMSHGVPFLWPPEFYCWHVCSSALHILSFKTLGFICRPVPQREPFWRCKMSVYNTEIQTKILSSLQFCFCGGLLELLCCSLLPPESKVQWVSAFLRDFCLSRIFCSHTLKIMKWVIVFTYHVICYRHTLLMLSKEKNRPFIQTCGFELVGWLRVCITRELLWFALLIYVLRALHQTVELIECFWSVS